MHLLLNMFYFSHAHFSNAGPPTLGQTVPRLFSEQISIYRTFILLVVLKRQFELINKYHYCIQNTFFHNNACWETFILPRIRVIFKSIKKQWHVSNTPGVCNVGPICCGWNWGWTVMYGIQAKWGTMSPVKQYLPRGHGEYNLSQFSSVRREEHKAWKSLGALESIAEQRACR